MQEQYGDYLRKIRGAPKQLSATSESGFNRVLLTAQKILRKMVKNKSSHAYNYKRASAITTGLATKRRCMPFNLHTQRRSQNNSSPKTCNEFELQTTGGVYESILTSTAEERQQQQQQPPTPDQKHALNCLICTGG